MGEAIRETEMKTKIFLSALTASVLCAWSAPSIGGALFVDGRSGCTTVNCATQKLFGRYEISQPWVAQIYAQANECLRLAVVKQSHDLEMGVFSPDIEENHWVNDDAGGSFRPLIKIDPTPVAGYYVVALSHVVGSAVKGNFQLLYGRYPSGNPNCTNPTPVGVDPRLLNRVPDEGKLGATR